ncbi:hypothetical protein ACQUY5_18620 [Bacillus cereus]|uniref:hypothetical protein n=1 Tax=Bacillus cereus TaxID=1396 RepID=UPI003D183A19
MLSGLKRLFKPNKQAMKEKDIIINIKVKQKDIRRLEEERALKIDEMCEAVKGLSKGNKDEVSIKLTNDIMEINMQIDPKIEECNEYIQEQLDKAKYMKLDIKYIEEMVS